MTKITTYGKLCSLFYDATKEYASQEEVLFYAQFMNKQGRVLEAMCGSGRLLIPLQLAGYTIDGVDNSPAMLSRCNERAKELGISVNIYDQSLEHVSLPYTYDAITIAVGSFQLITDRLQALNALKELNKVMKPGAHLLIDTFIPLDSSDSSSKAVRIDNQTVLTLSTQYTYHESAQRADALCTYELFIDGIKTESEEETIQVTWYTDVEFKNLLEQAGFEYQKLYEETFPVTGPSRIVHAKKAGD